MCTLGPACWDKECLVQLIDEGMSIARLNFSHGDHEGHANTIKTLMEAISERPGKHVAIMLDTKGPEIRTGMLESGDKVSLKAGQVGGRASGGGSVCACVCVYNVGTGWG